VVQFLLRRLLSHCLTDMTVRFSIVRPAEARTQAARVAESVEAVGSPVECRVTVQLKMPGFAVGHLAKNKLR